MKDHVKKNYTPRTPDLAAWYATADEADFKYLAIVGLLMESAESSHHGAVIAWEEESEKIKGQLTKAEAALVRYEKQLRQAAIGEKAHYQRRVKSTRHEIRSIQKELKELKRDIELSMGCALPIAKACEQFVEDMPEALKVETSTVRQDFYVSKNRTCERDYYAHQSLDQVVQSARSN